MNWRYYQTFQHYNKENNKFVLEVPMIGLKKKEISLKVVGDTLHLSSKGNKFAEEAMYKWQMPDGTSADNVTGRLENGIMVIEVSMPKQYEQEIAIK